MVRKLFVVVAIVASCTACLAGAGFAGIPSPATSTCAIGIVQFPVVPACVIPGAVPVVRLCPMAGGAPPFDTVTFTMTILDALGFPCPGVPVKVYELGGTVNLSASSSTVTTATGTAVVGAAAGSGCGLIGVCAGGVLMCTVMVRSPDVTTGALPAGCPLLPAPASFVNANDFTNLACGYLSKFGPITAANACWNLNCDAVVNAADVLGSLGKGGVLQHFGHGMVLGPLNTCP